MSSSNTSNENRSNSSTSCSRGCGAEIYFDDKFVSKNGKKIPLEKKDGKPHQCPNRPAYVKQQPVNHPSNLDEKVIEAIASLVQAQKDTKNELRVWLDHVSQRINTLQYEVQKLKSVGGST